MTTKIYLEKIQAALEATRGTAIADPTHILPMISGTVTPQKTWPTFVSRGCSLICQP